MNESVDRVYLLPKDPRWAFIWWELRDPGACEVVATAGVDLKTAQFCLRLHDITDIIFDGQNSHWHHDIEVHGLTDHWYLQVPASNRVYCVEAAFVWESRFCPLARSNPAYVPHNGPSAHSAERWSNISLL
jgi:hypothetical protein